MSDSMPGRKLAKILGLIIVALFAVVVVGLIMQTQKVLDGSQTKTIAHDGILNIQQITSPGGITAWLVEDHSVPVIAVELAFKNAGTAQDPIDKQGLVRMVSNTLDEGAGDLESQAFQQELTNHSITLRYGANRDALTGSLKTLSKYQDKAFDLLALSLLEPRFDPAPFDRMRAENLARIRKSLSDPEWLTARLFNDVYFGDHPYAKNSGGTLSTLPILTPGDARNFHARALAKDNLLIAVAGDITAQDLGEVLDNVFGGLPNKSQTQKFAPFTPSDVDKDTARIVLHPSDIPQTVIHIGQRAIDHMDPLYQAAQIMNFILGGSGFGSRLTEEVREKRGLTYGIYSYILTRDLDDLLMIQTSTENQNVAEVLEIIHTEISRLRDEPITEQTLKDAQTYLIGSLPLSLSSTNAIAGLMLSLQMDGLPMDYLERRREQIEQATIEDVRQVAQDMLSPDALTIVMTGAPDGVTPDKVMEDITNVR